MKNFTILYACVKSSFNLILFKAHFRRSIISNIRTFYFTKFYFILCRVYTVRKFVLNICVNLTYFTSQMVHSNYYVNLTQDEYVKK